ncbi:hypothetical protein ACQP00_27670 [Dactylosporangium sp. CS-047395]|uniref:hypothetical protein n=1 Tax=Dactylosporangium sp. CS-047395 TaxID=3239936 RepID=UPI003D8A0BDF
MTDDADKLRRRLEVLRLPVAPLRRHGVLAPSDPAATVDVPGVAGVGPDGTAVAVWPYRDAPGRQQVTWHVLDRRHAVAAVDIATDLRLSFVQPLPEGRVLVASARARPGEPNAEVWTAAGDLERRAHLGDAIEDLFTTAAGKVWASYFDEALGGPGPEGHGLARFNDDLSVDWLYPRRDIVDCYTLNLTGETAYFCPYTDFHILSATGDRVTDWGESPYRYAHTLLRRGPELALIRGHGAEYDVATLLRLGSGGVVQQGAQCRIVFPDGLETQRVRYFARADRAHAFVRSTWYTIDLDDLTAAAS